MRLSVATCSLPKEGSSVVRRKVDERQHLVLGKRPSPSAPSGNPRKKAVLHSFLVRTSATQKAELDEQVAKMVYVTNSAFRLVDHPEFLNMVEMLRPGYRPPTRHDVADKYLP